MRVKRSPYGSLVLAINSDNLVDTISVQTTHLFDGGDTTFGGGFSSQSFTLFYSYITLVISNILNMCSHVNRQNYQPLATKMLSKL